MKTLVFRIVTDIDDHIENMDEYITDMLYDYAEGIGEHLEIMSDLRESTPEEAEAFKESAEDV